MTSLRCPICRLTVNGDGEMDISHNLRDHLASAHGIQDLCETGQGAMPQNREIGSRPQDRGPEDWEKIKSGAAPAEMEVGEAVEQSVLCPFCSSRVFGHDTDDLSKKLHDHIEDVHDLRPSRLVARLRL